MPHESLFELAITDAADGARPVIVCEFQHGATRETSGRLVRHRGPKPRQGRPVGCFEEFAVVLEYYDKLEPRANMRQVRINPIRDIVIESVQGDPRGSFLKEFLEHGAQIYVVAGALRDSLTAHYEGAVFKARDFDIAIRGVSREDFDWVLSNLGQRNRHGGYALRAESAPGWDVWRMEETIGFRKTGASCSIENALRSFNLDCNAIALDLRTGLFLDGGAIAAIRKKQVDFVQGALQHSEKTFAAKAVLLNLRLGYALSDDLKQFVKSHLEGESLTHEATKVFPLLGLFKSLSQCDPVGVGRSLDAIPFTSSRGRHHSAHSLGSVRPEVTID